MDVIGVLIELIVRLWWIFPFAFVVGLLTSSAAKGYVGELVVRLLTPFYLSKSIYRPLHNLTLPTLDGTTQMDHVYVSPYGIFVLETKNMNGWIFGGEYQAEWTQKFRRKSFRFQNPLRQNFKHVKALEAALEVPLTSIHSIVTFVGGSSFKTPMPRNVTEGGGFISYIRSFRTRVFSEEQISMFIARLETVRLAPSLSSHRQHVRHLNTRGDPTASRLCARCGAAMVLRTARGGTREGKQFWGCSGYPKCKTIQNVG
jgi:hypothetical protein